MGSFLIFIGKRDGKYRGMGPGCGLCPREAFRCPEANLLPYTKFVSNGFLIKCLGQVDLRDAPLKHHTDTAHTPAPSPCISLVISVGKIIKTKPD
ncbi:hypothetical protein K040078D81_56130 [Blautia hominis]|uniref:Uncharacterized protein n=1 Tax=Blautia hominis TaxID=2025493 RepID=A0ABQ0BJ69_9FIRM